VGLPRGNVIRTCNAARLTAAFTRGRAATTTAVSGHRASDTASASRRRAGGSTTASGRRDSRAATASARARPPEPSTREPGPPAFRTDTASKPTPTEVRRRRFYLLAPPSTFYFRYVCLSVRGISDYARTAQPIFVNFDGKVVHWPRKVQLDFGGNSDKVTRKGWVMVGFVGIALRLTFYVTPGRTVLRFGEGWPSHTSQHSVRFTRQLFYSN